MGRLAAAHALEDHPFLGLVRVPHPELQQEAVHLGLGQGVGALLLDGVLGGQDQEGIGQREGLLADGDLPLLHGLQQRALHLGRGAVDLVGQDDAVEHRALLHRELARLAAVDGGAHDVGGQQVRRELDALEAGLDGLGQGAHGQGLGQAGDALEQDVAVGHQAEEHALDHLALADHHPAHLVQHRLQPAGDLLGLRLIQGVLLHGHLSLAFSDPGIAARRGGPLASYAARTPWFPPAAGNSNAGLLTCQVPVRGVEWSPGPRTAKETGVKLSQTKIEYLADRLVTMMQETGGIHLASNVETVWKTVADTIYANMRAEQEIDDEVDTLIEKHRREIRGQEMDVGDLRRKFKRELARKRGFTL